MTWLAIYTKPRWEKKVHSLLIQKGIESYCPMNTVVKQWADRKKKVEIPLFTSYLFVQITNEQYMPVRATAGVVNFVYWLGKPAAIPNSDMEILKQFVSKHQNIVLENIEYKQGQNLILTEGVFKGQEAEVLNVNSKRVELVLKTLNIKLIVST
jgi:transcription antitermination factor NusG